MWGPTLSTSLDCLDKMTTLTKEHIRRAIWLFSSSCPFLILFGIGPPYMGARSSGLSYRRWDIESFEVILDVDSPCRRRSSSLTRFCGYLYYYLYSFRLFCLYGRTGDVDYFKLLCHLKLLHSPMIYFLYYFFNFKLKIFLSPVIVIDSAITITGVRRIFNPVERHFKY